jgi:hypothetical protein
VSVDLETIGQVTREESVTTEHPPVCWLSTRQCAAIVGVTANFMRGEIRDGRLKARTLARHGKRTVYRVVAEDFAAYCAKHWRLVDLAAPRSR